MRSWRSPGERTSRFRCAAPAGTARLPAACLSQPALRQCRRAIPSALCSSHNSRLPERACRCSCPPPSPFLCEARCALLIPDSSAPLIHQGASKCANGLKLVGILNSGEGLRGRLVSAQSHVNKEGGWRLPSEQQQAARRSRCKGKRTGDRSTSTSHAGLVGLTQRMGTIPYIAPWHLAASSFKEVI